MTDYENSFIRRFGLYKLLLRKKGELGGLSAETNLYASAMRANIAFFGGGAFLGIYELLKEQDADLTLAGAGAASAFIAAAAFISNVKKRKGISKQKTSLEAEVEKLTESLFPRR